MGRWCTLALLLTALLAAGCQGQNGEDSGASENTPSGGTAGGLEVRDRFSPGMTFPRLAVADPAGNRYDLYNLLNKPHNLVLFIDAYCAACGEEGEKLQRFLSGRADVNLIGVSRDSLPAIADFRARYKLRFPVLRDLEDKLVPDYRKVFFPTLVLVGADKKIIRLYEGEIPADEAGPLLKTLFGL